MLAPTYSVTDYLQQFLRLLPPGRVWRRGWGTAMTEFLLTLMPTWPRLQDRASALLIDAFPCSTVELLPEWEATLGLPDPCTGPLPTVQERTAAVCAAFRLQGGVSAQNLKDLAASLGANIAVETFSPFQVSANRIGEPLYDEAWAYACVIHVRAPATATYFTVSRSAVGEPLVSYGNKQLECLLAANVPAHITIAFAYGTDWDDGASIWDAGNSTWDGGVQTGTVWDVDRSHWDHGTSQWDMR